jgi:hypothetical protein
VDQANASISSIQEALAHASDQIRQGHEFSEQCKERREHDPSSGPSLLPTERKLVEIQRLLDDTVDPVRRRMLSNRVWQLRRRAAKARMRYKLGKLNAASNYASLLPTSFGATLESQTCDTALWADIAAQHQQEVHADSVWGEAWARWESHHDANNPSVERISIPSWFIEAARAKTPVGKKEGADGVPNEMLRALDATSLEKLRCAMEDLINNEDRTDILGWVLSYVALLPKPGKDRRLAGCWRGITLLPNLYKLYERVWLRVIKEYMPKFHRGIYGFQPSRQTEEISQGIRILFAKAYEWGLPLVCASADIVKAFDKMHPLAVLVALRQLGVPACILHAWSRFRRAQRNVVRMGGKESKAVEYETGLPQGGPATPNLWNAVVSRALKWCERNWGVAVHWMETVAECGVFFWADNLYIIASTPEALQERLDSIFVAFDRLDMSFGAASLELLRNEFFPNVPFKMGTNDFVEVQELRILGNMCDRRGSTEAAMQHRATMAQGVLHRHIRLLANTGAPLHERIAATCKTVFVSMLFASGGWTPSRAVIRFLEAKEKAIFRRIANTKKQEAETWVEFYRRTNEIVRVASLRAGVVPLAVQYLRKWAGWAGHIGRQCRDLQEATLAAQTIMWRRRAWWEALKAISTRHRRHEQTLRHPHFSWPKTNDDILSEVLCDHWVEETYERAEWKAHSITIVERLSHILQVHVRF